MSQQLNGWFGRTLKKVIVYAAGRIDSYLDNASGGISNYLMDAVGIGSFTELVQDIGSGGSEFWNRTTQIGDIDLSMYENDPRAAYEPSLMEEAQLMAFSDDLSYIIAQIMNEFEASTAEPLVKVNRASRRIAVLKEYYALNELQLISEPCADLRDLIIEVMVIPIETMIQAVIDKMSIDSVVKMYGVVSIKPFTPIADLNPTFPQSQTAFEVQYPAYRLKIPLDFGTGTIPTNPKTDTGNGTPIDSGTGTETEPNDSGIVIGTEPIGTGTETTTTENKSTKGFKILGSLFIVGLLIGRATKNK